jgi:hypothetical protein
MTAPSMSGSEPRALVKAITEDRTPAVVHCMRCTHDWIAFYLPMPLANAVDIMRRVACPMCAAGIEQIAFAMLHQS